MLINQPMPFLEALLFAKGKQALPTSLSSAELRMLGRKLKQRSLFSARVEDGRFLHELDVLIQKMVGGPTDEDYFERAAGHRPLLVSIPDAKAALSEYLDAVGYQPEPGEEGTIKDLSSEARRKLIVETNFYDTMGFGRWAAGQNKVEMELFPALELVRMRLSERPRDWEQRWEDARAEVGEEGSTSAASGQMVALKNHPIWQALGDGAGGYTDTLGNPWPPFAFNSGMNTLRVRAEEAIELGIMAPDEAAPEAESLNRLNESLEANISGWSEALRRAVSGDGLEIIDGILSLANSEVEAFDFSTTRERLRQLANALELANEGTTEGAIKGWITRRNGGKIAGEAFDQAMKPGGHAMKAVPFLQVGESEARRIQKTTGLDVRGFSHVLDGEGLRHVAKRHGDPVREAHHGQRTATKEDYNKLPVILGKPDSVTTKGGTPQRKLTILYKKKIGDEFHYVEEVRAGRKQLALKTYWIKKG